MSEEQVKQGKKNVLTLPIQNAKSLRCTVIEYDLGHGLLRVQVDRGGSWRGRTTFYLTFQAVEYYEGPLQWDNADFRTGSEDELKEVFDRLHFWAGRNRKSTDKADEYRLFIVDTEYGPVKILAYRTVLRFKKPPLKPPLVPQRLLP